VLDTTGAALHGVTVTVAATDGVKRTAMTDGVGAFAFDGVPPGRYTVTAALQGFAPQSAGVVVSRRTPKPLTLTLPLAGMHQEITVTGGTPQVATNPSANANAISVTQSTIDSLPIFDDDPVATLSAFLDAGAVGTGGATLLVNGMEVNSLDVSASAIQQIKINQDPYSALYSRPGRGRIDIITKPGSQQFDGSGSVIARDARLNARNAFATVRPPEQRRIADGYLGGPLGDGRHTSFMASVKADSRDQQAIVFALGPNGQIRDNAAEPYRHLLASVAINHQRGASTISIRPSYEQEQETSGAGGTTLASAATTYYHREIDLTYNQQTVLRPTLLNQFRMLAGQELEPRTSVSAAPGLVVNGAFTGGGAQVDLRRTEAHIQLSENLALTRGQHFLQVGFQIPDWSRRGFYDRSGFGGTYSFADLTAYEAGTPYAFTERQGNGDVVWVEKVLGFYANDDWELGSRATLSAGLRYDWSNYFHDHDNVAPRLSFAVKPTGGNFTVIRGGAGLFYDKVGPFPVIDVMNYRPGGIQQVLLANPPYPDPYAGGASLATLPQSTAQFAPGIQVPWTLEYSAGVEQQLWKTATLSVMYDGADGTLFRSRDLNAPLPPLYLARPNPAYSTIQQIDSTARQQSNAIEVTLRGRIGTLFNGQVQYRLSRAMNNAGGWSWYPANDYDLSGEWARADFDRRHRLMLLGGMTPGRGFNVGVSLQLESGAPYTLLLGQDIYNNGRGNARPAGVPRNSLQGAGLADLDVRVSRDFHLGGSGDAARVLTIGLDAFNVLNTVNYTNYVGVITSPLFGQPVSASSPRQLQVSARVTF
ncbi:MAG: carboxypeptidase regulatory-like domain-containing protein, partial [Vicinamibacterales bacterium]